MNFVRLSFIALACAAFTVFSADTVHINVGDNVKSIIEANTAAGTVFYVHAGLYRGVGGIALKGGQEIVGELGPNGERLAIFSGAIELKNWVKEGEYWVHDLSSYSPQRNYAFWPGHSDIQSDLYFDDLFLYNCVSKAYFDTFHWNTDIWPIGPYEQLEDINKLKASGDLTWATWFWDSTLKKAYLKDDPDSHKIELSLPGGFGVATDGTALIAVKNIVTEKYATPYQGMPLGCVSGAVNNANGCADSNRWGAVFDNVESRWNHSGGLGFHGCAQGFMMKNCYAHHNGQIGVKFVGTKNAQLIGCHIGNNCFERTIGFIPNENGGTKFAAGNENMVLRGNYVHHNWDNGLWLDGDNMNCILEGNIVAKNTGAGIFLEINEPTSEFFSIRYNVARRNGYCGWFYAPQIQISVTHSVEIYNNVLEVDWMHGGHMFCIIYQIDDQDRRLRPPHHIIFRNNDCTWNDANACPGIQEAPWQPTVAGNTKIGFGISVWGDATGGTAVNVPDSIRVKRLAAYEAQMTCVDTCGNRMDSNTYHCKWGAGETEDFKYWRWPDRIVDTTDWENDGIIDFDYDMHAYSLKGIQDTLGLEVGSTVDNVLDTNIASQLQKVLNFGAPDSIVAYMGKHFGLTVADVRAYVPQAGIYDNGNSRIGKLNGAIAAYRNGMLKLSLPIAGLYKVALMDARGRIIMKQQFMGGKNASKAAMDMRNLSAGIYTVKVMSAGREMVQKVAVCK